VHSSSLLLRAGGARRRIATFVADLKAVKKLATSHRKAA
jgi:hypothetical protein